MKFPFFDLFSSQDRIIPVINVKTRHKFEERLHQLNKFTGIIQIDVADGIFTSWKNWNSPEELKSFKNIRRRFELHLMIQNPEFHLPSWLETQPKRIIIHQEAMKDFQSLQALCQKNKVELALALNPDTPLEKIEPFLKVLPYLVVLGVSPGPSGQKFQGYVLDKIQAIKKRYPSLKIEVDGGINEENIKEIAKAGGDYFALGSALFDNPQPQERIAFFQQLLYENEKNN